MKCQVTGVYIRLEIYSLPVILRHRNVYNTMIRRFRRDNVRSIHFLTVEHEYLNIQILEFTVSEIGMYVCMLYVGRKFLGYIKYISKAHVRVMCKVSEALYFDLLFR